MTNPPPRGPDESLEGRPIDHEPTETAQDSADELGGTGGEQAGGAG